MRSKKIFSAVLTMFTVIFLISGSLTPQAAENTYRYRSDVLYNALETAAEKRFYDELTASCEKVDNSYDYFDCIDRVYYPLSIDRDRAIEVMIIFINDNPQYFWLSTTYTVYTGYLGFLPVNGVEINVIDYFKDGDIRQSAKIKIKKAEQEYIDGALKYSTQYERAQYLHDTLLQNVGYKTGDWDQTVASVFLQGDTVCAGYSKAYQLLCCAVGIDAVVVTSVDHAWNIIEIDDHWFIVDVTNDYKTKKYFLISDQKLAEIDNVMGAPERHAIDRSTYINYYSAFPSCPCSYTDISPAVHPVTELWGDANGDGIVNIRDAAYIAICLSGGNESLLSEYADYNRDGKINIRDAAALAKALSKAA